MITKAAPSRLAPDEVSDDAVAHSGVDRSACDYQIFGTSRRRDFIFSVR
jgi:hypothetical protein